MAGDDIQADYVIVGGGSAADGIVAMISAAASALRDKVLDNLRDMVGCTHLNDATRALDAVPWLGRELPEALD